MAAPRVVFYVQYLLGIGHVRRSSLIVQALCEQGVQVDVIFGGLTIPNMSFANARVHQLTPIKSADANFSDLVKADGSAFTAQDKIQRCAQLLAICEQLQPNLIVTETYPFGRRQMRFELLPLLDWVSRQKAPPVLVASIRDILQRRSSTREQECLDLIERHYQQVLVHGDPHFYPLEKSFPPATCLAAKLNYTGYVCPQLTELSNDLSNIRRREIPAKTIIVSIGGGSVGKEILTTALALHDSGFGGELKWLLVTGPNMPDNDKAHFKAQQSDNLQVVELADNFLQKLNQAYVSVSMAGYNTIMDLLVTQTAAVVIPFEGTGETEQMARSELLAKANIVQLLKNTDLSADNLKHCIGRALENSQTKPVLEINNAGAQNSADLLIDWAQEQLHKATYG
jgi:predicted glycosyltransferase